MSIGVKKKMKKFSVGLPIAEKAGFVEKIIEYKENQYQNCNYIGECYSGSNFDL